MEDSAPIGIDGQIIDINSGDGGRAAYYYTQAGSFYQPDILPGESGNWTVKPGKSVRHEGQAVVINSTATTAGLEAPHAGHSIYMMADGSIESDFHH